MILLGFLVVPAPFDDGFAPFNDGTAPFDDGESLFLFSASPPALSVRFLLLFGGAIYPARFGDFR